MDPVADADADESTLSGRYRLDSLVARGGMAEIWIGTDLETDARVAIKRLFLWPGQTVDAELRSRLLRETEALRRLSHPRVVRYLDAGFDKDGHPFLALEWLEGENLAARQQRAPLSLNLATEVARQTLDALDICHGRGIIHRDIKPANLFLVGDDDDSPEVRVVDFGLARVGGDLTRLTRTGVVMGTLHYLAPEQVRANVPLDHRVDIYAVGVVLYELCTGQLPFRAEEPVAVMLKIVSDTPEFPTQVRPEIPTWLEDVILRAMRRSPADRYASAAEMARALEGQTAERTRSMRAPVQAELRSLEHRLVCLLCVEPASTEDVPSTLFDAVEHEVAAAGGTSLRLLGRQAVGFFGLERTSGDEALRTVRAGLNILGSRAVALPLRRDLRLQAATIHVEVGQGLHLDSQELDRIGRALGQLPPGELVLDEGTRHLLGDQVQLHRLGEHFAVRSLRQEATGGRRVLGELTPLVGREVELAGLRATIERAFEEEEPEAVLLLGPAGIGKSRLLQEAMPELRDRCKLCLEARPDSSRVGTPYSLLADGLFRAAGIHIGQERGMQQRALRGFVDRLGATEVHDSLIFIGAAIGIPDEEAPLLATARSDPKVMHEGITRAFIRLVEAAGAHGPVALCLDDLHWADGESLRLCVQLVEQLPRTPLVLLATARPELLEREPRVFPTEDTEVVEVKPLRPKAMGRLVRSVLGSRLSADVEALLVARSDGNPYFAEELISWMVAAGTLARTEKGWQLQGDPSQLELPAGIEGAIQGRLDRLDPELKDLLKSASAFGEVFWEQGCEALGHEACGELLGRLGQADFVFPHARARIAGTTEWAFRHSLVRQVAYHMLPQERRRELHLQAAIWLEEVGETDAAILAYHFEKGGDIARAADCHARAGARALTEGSLERAVAAFEASLRDEEAAPRVRCQRVMGLARALYRQGRYEEAAERLRGLDPVLDQVSATEWPQLSAKVGVLRGQILFCTSRYNLAETVLRRVTEFLDQHVPGGEDSFEGRQTLFWVIWAQGRYADAGRVGEELFELARTDGRGDHLCVSKLALAYYHVVDGDLSRSLALSEEAGEHARQIGHPFREVDALLALAAARELVGLYEEALATLHTAHEAATRVTSPQHLAGIETLLGRVNAALGRLDEAMRHFGSAAGRARALGDNRTLAIAMAGEARTRCQAAAAPAELEAGAQLATGALVLVADSAPPVEAEAHLALALIHLRSDRPAEAVTEALAAVALLDALGAQERFEIEILLAAHDALVAAGRAEEAAPMLRRAAERLQQRAGHIEDAGVRASFLGRVPHNVRVRELAGELV
jgi:tetratricopeptide (TPR) repeat protein/tRNA A-37 threonylcarbamoyl transferase component Bud32